MVCLICNGSVYLIITWFLKDVQRDLSTENKAVLLVSIPNNPFNCCSPMPTAAAAKNPTIVDWEIYSTRKPNL